MKNLIETLDFRKEEKIQKLTMFVSICSFIRNMLNDAHERASFANSNLNKELEDTFKRHCVCEVEGSEYICEHIIEVWTNAALNVEFCEKMCQISLPVFLEKVFSTGKYEDLKEKIIGLVARLCKFKGIISKVAECTNMHRCCVTAIMSKNTKIVPNAIRVLSYEYDVVSNVFLFEIEQFCKSVSSLLTELCVKKD